MDLMKRWWNDWFRQWAQPEAWDWRAALAIMLGSLLLWPLTNLLPMLGYDWYIYFWQHDFRQYPQWIEWSLAPLLALPWRTGLAWLNAILLMSVAVAAAREVYRRATRITAAVRVDALLAALMALLTIPVLVLLWVGNIDGLALMGLLVMPVGIFWITLKPHLGLWAVLSRRSWTIWAIIFCGVMLLLFPGWPFRLVASLGDRLQHTSAFGWASLGVWMIPIGIVLLVKSPADPVMLIAAGCFLSPFLMPQHFVLLAPAYGRVSGLSRLLLWVVSWLLIIPLAVPGVWGGLIKALALFYPLLVWFLLRKSSIANSPVTVNPL
jgi:hypothetical protein